MPILLILFSNNVACRHIWHCKFQISYSFSVYYVLPENPSVYGILCNISWCAECLRWGVLAAPKLEDPPLVVCSRLIQYIRSYAPYVASFSIRRLRKRPKCITLVTMATSATVVYLLHQVTDATALKYTRMTLVTVGRAVMMYHFAYHDHCGSYIYRRPKWPNIYNLGWPEALRCATLVTELLKCTTLIPWLTYTYNKPVTQQLKYVRSQGCREHSASNI